MNNTFYHYILPIIIFVVIPIMIFYIYNARKSKNEEDEEKIARLSEAKGVTIFASVMFLFNWLASLSQIALRENNPDKFYNAITKAEFWNITEIVGKSFLTIFVVYIIAKMIINRLIERYKETKHKKEVLEAFNRMYGDKRDPNDLRPRNY